MDWNGNLKQHCFSNSSFVSPLITSPDNVSNNSLYDYYPGLEMKYPVVEHTSDIMAVSRRDKCSNTSPSGDDSYRCRKRRNEEVDMKKKKTKLTYEQIEALERSFEEEKIKLEPEKKMKLAKDLGLDPRQIAVWFQNRRARWKAKHLEQLYLNLQHKYDVISIEKQKLHQEVSALKAFVKEQAFKNQYISAVSEVSGGETMDSTSIGHQSSGRLWTGSSHQHVNHEGSNIVLDDCNLVAPAYWTPVLPKSCPN